MFKKCEIFVNNVWVNCDNFCVKLWVKINEKINVGKNIDLFTFQPTHFQQAFSTHTPHIKTNYSPLSTTPTMTINYIKEKK
ncbi:hypothetical protein LJC64_03590 [Ruminococcaceae bacterium OttesenSCG-928-A11]|nr:hypothetical protein [Ruminococcaceae bacterium OttesenSCG-928-A11]